MPKVRENWSDQHAVEDSRYSLDKFGARGFGREYIVIWLRERDEESEQMNFRFGETEENSGTTGETLNYLN